MITIAKKLLLSLICSFLLLTPIMASAQLGSAQTNLDKALKGTGLNEGTRADLSSTIGVIIKTILSLVGTIFLILMVYAGILWMTAQGNNEKVEKAQGIIKMAIIGLIVVMSAYAITAFVTLRLTK
ncbi:MAG: hypothetical protein US58_C0021G0007 [Candidatus Magasanikbacteria bacterium GW2011_GWA2_37_8]|uniref:Integral membrane protein n=1 Tax=Candidatus Magasanikbacteria bacterium GW2011_GWA2_37_8 TaxID=1619036 RepID=A0A0G0HP59_9BACT|nr:MAG: hypothetical protein US58_C0021G0007 [Candidatus Magasanikbacteria bacterium GW2011_GWA2_37_8]